MPKSNKKQKQRVDFTFETQFCKAVYRIVPVPARLTCKIFQLSGGMQNNFSSKMEQ